MFTSINKYTTFLLHFFERFVGQNYILTFEQETGLYRLEGSS